ncbi:response regulator [Herbaspirillum camelliae]|uniref:response regulator n=1 Tax=Herbaspirillum camelliae TaxID=1892903 RepID=UPI000949E5D1|nr:response regulator [Herbaspirillum camelliae]
MQAKTDSEKYHFLVVDDFGTMRRIVSGLLKQLDYVRISEADDGISAMKILESGGSDINFILTDWNMPGMDGMSLLKKVRSTPDLMHLPVLMITAEGKRENIVEAATAGADGYIVKPFNAVTLKEKIDKIINRRSAMVAARSGGEG